MKKLTKMNLQLFAGMKNVDLINQKKEEVHAKMQKAIKEGNEEEFVSVFTEYTEMLQEAVIAEARGMIQAADNQVLIGRGVRALTSEETEYYQKVIGAMKTSNPAQALADLDVVLPKTTIDSVFEDLRTERPILDLIDFQNTSGLIEFISNTNDNSQLATWDTLTSTIVTELTSGFAKLDLTQKKLSAFLPVAKSMLDLGPVWLDRYTRTILAEALLGGVEKGVIKGNGLKEPIGMIRDLSVAVDPVTGYAAKTQVALTEITPATYGALVSNLIVNPNGGYRKVNEVLLIVNPVDYLTKIMPATTVRGTDGTYVNNIFPFPTKVEQSVELEPGEAILGLPKKYFMGIGTAKTGKIEYSDQYKFLEDERVYLVKLYGNGKPRDNNAFIYLDISALVPTIQPVVIDGIVQTQEVV